MDRKHFRGILKRYLQSRATPEEEEIIDSWYGKMGKYREPLLKKEDGLELEHRYWSAINAHIQKNKVRRLIPWKSIGIAASLFFAVLTSLYLTLSKQGQENTIVREEARVEEWQRVFNNGENTRHVTLSDGSTVALEPQSHLRFPTTFSDDGRIVFLEGEAFFDVSPDRTKPFLVYTHQLTTKVLGTSFRVRAFAKDKNVTIAVRTGKVSVSTRADVTKDESAAAEIILTPNQQIVFDKERNKLSRMIVEEPRPILPDEEVRQMRFESAPVAEIFEAIERVYGVDLVFDKDKFSSCMLTSVISDGDLYNRLDIICKAIGATYSFRENQIVIEGIGCDLQ